MSKAFKSGSKNTLSAMNISLNSNNGNNIEIAKKRRSRKVVVLLERLAAHIEGLNVFYLMFWVQYALSLNSY